MYTNTPVGFEFRFNSNQWPVVSDSVVINYTYIKTFLVDIIYQWKLEQNPFSIGKRLWFILSIDLIFNPFKNFVISDKKKLGR